MDPHIRWLRRYVVSRVVERVAVEAGLIGVAVGLAADLDGSSPAEAGALAVIAAVTITVLRVLLAVGTNPINHRYLLRWTDPSSRLRIAPGPRPNDTRSDDARTHEVGLPFLLRLERADDRTDDQVDGPGDERFDEEAGPGIDVFKVEGTRLIVARSDDGELSALTRLSDGRALVTSHGFVPPMENLIVQRIEGRRGTTEALVSTHVAGLRQLRHRGIDAVGTDPGAVVALLRTEWEAWQQLGPVIGPLVAMGPRRTIRLGLQVDVPAAMILDRTANARLGRMGDRPATAEPPPSTTGGDIGSGASTGSGIDTGSTVSPSSGPGAQPRVPG